jgi:hypothetical protein
VVENQKALCALLHIDKLDRQLPVGVFKDRVSRDPGHRVFTGGHSTIDIWGVDKMAKRLFLFELKKDGNEKLGILSELFFYAYVMADVQAGRFTFQKPNTDIAQTESIEAFILAPLWHPLIDDKLLAMVNQAFSRNSLRIRFGAVKIERKPEIFTVVVGAKAG